MSKPTALPTPTFFRDLPLPGLTAGPGVNLDFRIGLSPTGPGVKRGHWIWFIILAPLILPLMALAVVVIVLGLVVTLVTALLAPFLPAARRKIRTMIFNWRHPVTFELDRHPVVPGESAAVRVHQRGAPRLDGLQLVLVCREEARYRVGTDTRTEKKNVFETIVADLGPDEISDATEASFTVPEDAMHSFKATNNTVEWVVEARRRVPGGNESVADAEFQVLPLGVVERILNARAAEGLT